MADPFAIEPPAWLQAIAKPIDTQLTGQNIATVLGGVAGAGEVARQREARGEPAKGWFGNFLEAAGQARLSMIDPFWQLKAQHAQLGILQDTLGLAETSTKLKMLREEAANEASDLPVMAEWQRGGMVGTPLLKSRKWNQIASTMELRKAEQQRAQNTTTAAKIEQETASEFLDRVAKLPPDLRGAFSGMLGKVPTAEAWQALAVAENAHRQMQDVDLSLARIRGETITQTTGPKGETTVVKTAGAPGYKLGEVIESRDPRTGELIAQSVVHGPNTTQVRFEKPDVMTAYQRGQLLRTRGAALKAELDNLSTTRADPKTITRRADLLKELDDVNRQLKELTELRMAPPPPLPPASTNAPGPRRYIFNEKTGHSQPQP